MKTFLLIIASPFVLMTVIGGGFWEILCPWLKVKILTNDEAAFINEERRKLKGAL